MNVRNILAGISLASGPVAGMALGSYTKETEFAQGFGAAWIPTTTAAGAAVGTGGYFALRTGAHVVPEKKAKSKGKGKGKVEAKAVEAKGKGKKGKAKAASSESPAVPTKKEMKAATMTPNGGGWYNIKVGEVTFPIQGKEAAAAALAEIQEGKVPFITTTVG